MASTFLSRFRGAPKSPPEEQRKTSRRARKRFVRNAQLGATVAELVLDEPASAVDLQGQLESTEGGPRFHDQGIQSLPEAIELRKEGGVQTLDVHRRVATLEAGKETQFGALLRAAFGQKAYFQKVTGVEDDERAQAVEHFNAPKHAFEDLHQLPRLMRHGLQVHRYGEALRATLSEYQAAGQKLFGECLVALHAQSLLAGVQAQAEECAKIALAACAAYGEECVESLGRELGRKHFSSSVVSCPLGISYRELRLWGPRLQYPLFLGEGVAIAYGCDALPGMTGILSVPKDYAGPVGMAGVESGDRCRVMTGKQPGARTRGVHRMAGSTIAWQSRFVATRPALRDIRAGDVVYSLVGARRADGYWQTDDLDLSRVGGVSAFGVIVTFRLLAVRRLSGGGFLQYARVDVEPWRTRWVYRAVSQLCDCGRVDPQLLMIQSPAEPRGAFAALGNPSEEATIRAAWSLAEQGLAPALASVYNQHKVLAIARKTSLDEVHPLDIRARLEMALQAMGVQPGPGAAC